MENLKKFRGIEWVNLTAKTLRIIFDDNTLLILEPGDEIPAVVMTEEAVMPNLSIPVVYYKTVLLDKAIPSEQENRIYVANEAVARYAARRDVVCPHPGFQLGVSDVITTNRLLSFVHEPEIAVLN